MLKSKLKVMRRDELLLAIFYAAAGAAQIAVLVLTDFRFFPSGAFAVLSFIVAYGLLRTKRWSVWLIIGLFFPQFVFGAVVLYASILWYISYQAAAFLLLNVALAIFMVLSLVSFVYVAVKRDSFKQA
jgi:hypothetical protein